jgi:ATP adenylyltransferase
MKSLWAPWRMEYILGDKEEGCIFCSKPAAKRDEENLILFQGRDVFVMMNKFPYNNGHLMLVPKRHCVDLEELTDRESQELFDLMKTSVRVLKSTLRPHGFNVGINIGISGGAGEAHLHLHIVPRWTGDTNFMPVLVETKIIPQYLEETYKKLHSAFENLLSETERQKGGKEK